MTLNLGTLEASIAVDTTKAERALKTLEGKLTQTEVQLGKLEKGKPTVDVRAGKGLDEAKQKTTELGRALDGVNGKRAAVDVDTSGVKRGLGDAETAVKGFKQRADQEATVTPDVDVDTFDNKLDGLVGKVTKTAAAIGVAFSAFDFARDVTAAGREFQSEMNTLTAVSGASAEQLAAVQAKARELGSATDLTATSASDAAAAMTELAKGGFTVEQAMDAAKGTLQLASAAQLDAAQAATIQSQALQSFGLGASEAARVSDILAGAANASSAEMTGIALGMQQAGTVSKQFGLTIDDTATALAMFANAGIQGSDAGTLLKTALLSLTDQGKPAQQAMEELGLTVYDSQGKFVGLSSLMGQLQTASQNMTEEQYQAATATLFGSDAMRMAGIAAQQGADGFDTLKEAVTRQGQAAEVAAAQTAGLPGALERWENTVEDLQLGVFDAIQEEAVGALNLMVDMVDAAQPTIESLAQTAAAAAGDVLKLANAAANAPQGFKDAALGAGEFALVLAALKSGPVVAAFDQIKKGASATRNAFTDAGRVARDSAAHYGAQARAMKQVAAEQMVLARSADTARARANAFWAAHDAQWSAATNTVRAQTAAMGGLVSNMGTTMKRGLGSVVDMMGGPWMAGFAAAATATTMFVNAGRAVEQANEQVAISARKAAEAQRELKLAASGTEGMLSGDALAAAETMVAGSLAEITEKGAAANKIFGSVRTAMDEVGWQTTLLNGITQDATMEYQAALTAAREYGGQQEALAKALRDTGLSMDDVNNIVAQGGPEYDKLVESLRGLGPEGETVADSLASVREEIQRTADAGRELPDNFVQAARAIDVLADSASSAEDKLAAMDAMMVALGLRPKDAERAMMEFKESIDQTAQEIELMTRSTDFMGEAMFDASGKLQLQDANQATAELQKKIDGLATDLERAALKGMDMDDAMSQLEPTLQGIQQAWALTDEQMEPIRENLRQIAEASKFGVELEGADQATKELSTILTALKGASEDTYDLRIDVPSQEVLAALDHIGVEVNDLGNGKVSIPVTADTREAIAQLQDMSWVLDEAASKGVTIDALLNTEPLKVSAAEADQILAELAITNPSPEAQLIIDKLEQGVEISMGELAALEAISSTPKADLDPSLFNQGRDKVNSDLQAINNSKTTATIDADDTPARTKIGSFFSWVGSLFSKPQTVRVNARTGGGSSGYHYGGLVGYADGGYIPNIPGVSDAQRDPIVAVNDAGVPFARVEPREYVVNRDATAKNLPLLEAINAGRVTMGDLPGYAAGGVVSAMTDIVKSKFPMMTMTSGYRAGDSGYHGRGLAADFSNGSGNTPEMLALAKEIAKSFPNSRELIYDAPGWSGNIKDGRNVGRFGDFYTMGQAGPHHHHVHWAMDTAPTGGLNGGGMALTSPMKGSEANLTVNAVKAGRAVTQKFPGIQSIGGWRQDPYPDHPSGRALDIMIGSDMALGDRIKDYLFNGPFNMEYALWRQAQWNNASTGSPMADRGSPTQNHMDHVHAYFKPSAMAKGDETYTVDGLADDGVMMGKSVKKFEVHYGQAEEIARGVRMNTHKLAQMARYNAGIYDTGGILKHGQIAMNLSGHDEYVIPPALTNAVVKYLPQYADALPALTRAMNDFTHFGEEIVNTGWNRAGLTELGWGQVQSAKAGLRDLPADATEFDRWALYANRTAGEALMGAATMTNAQWVEAGSKLGLTFLDTYVSGLVSAQDDIELSYVAQVDAADALVEAQENVVKAQRQLNEVLGETPELSTSKQRQLEDAERKLAEAKAAPKAKSDKDGAAKAKKIADAERNLARVREDAATELEKNGAKDAEAALQAREALAEAEKELVTAESVVKATAAATGQAQIAMAIEAFATIRKVSKATFEFVERLADQALAARTGFHTAIATAAESMRDLIAATNEQQEAVQNLRMQAAELAMETGRRTFNLRQAQVGVMKAQLEGVRDVRKAESNLRNERLRAVKEQENRGRVYDFSDLSVEYDKYINSTHMSLGDEIDFKVSTEVAAVQSTTSVIVDNYQDRLAQFRYLSAEEKRLVEDVFSTKFANIELEKAALDQQLEFTVAYNTAAKLGMEDLLQQQYRVTPEILALQDLINEAEWRRQENVLAATLTALDAAYEQAEAMKGLHRLADDLEVAVARANRQLNMGMGESQATVLAELAKSEARIAQSKADIGNLGNRASRLFDWNHDGKTMFFDNAGSQKYYAAQATLASEEAYKQELLKKLGSGVQVELSPQDRKTFELAGRLLANGETERGNRLIQSTDIGKSAQALQLLELDRKLDQIEDKQLASQRAQQDMYDKVSYELLRLPRDYERTAAGMKADSYAFMADAKRSTTMGEALANVDLSRFSSSMADMIRQEASLAGVEIAQRLEKIMVPTLEQKNMVQRIQVDLAKDALYTSDQIESALTQVLGRVQTVELEVRQVQGQLTAGQARNAINSRAGLAKV